MEIGFIGRSAVTRRVRAKLVVPSEERSELPAKTSLALRNHHPSSCLVLYGSNETFDNGDAPVLPDRPVPQTDSLACARGLEGFAAENTVFVAD